MTTVTRDRKGKRLIVERNVRGSAELVWACWTEADRLREWWGPHGWRTDILELDLRIGGRWHYRLRPDREHELDEESWGVAVYETVNAPNLLHFLDSPSGPDGVATPETTMPTSVLITPTASGRTTVTITVGFPTVKDLEQADALGMVEGFTDALERLNQFAIVSTPINSTRKGSDQ